MVSEATTWHLLHGQGIRIANTFYQFIRRTPKSALLWVGFVCFIYTVRSLPMCMCTWAYVWILCVFRSQRIISAITHWSTCSISILQAHATSYVFFFFLFSYFLHKFWGLSSVLGTCKNIVLLTELPAPPSAYLPFLGGSYRSRMHQEATHHTFLNVKL